MAKITEEILKMLNINENTIGDYSGYKKKGAEYVLKLNDGSSRTYSERDFKNVFALSKIENDTGQKKTSELNFIETNGRNKNYNIVEHNDTSGKNRGYTADMDGKIVIQKAYVDIVKGDINTIQDYIKSMESDKIYQQQYREKRKNNGTLKTVTGSDKASINPASQLDKYLQQIKDFGFLTSEQAKRAEYFAERKRDAAEAARIRKIEDLKDNYNELKRIEKSLERPLEDAEKALIKDYEEAQLSRANFENFDRDIAKIQKSIKPDATLKDIEKKAQKIVSKKASVNNLLSQLQYTVADTQASAIKALEGTPMHGYATKGIWKIGQVQGSGPIKSAQSTINARDAKRVNDAFLKNSIKTTATQYNTNGYKYSAVSNLENAKKIINSGKGLYYDFETTGQRGSDNFGALQFSARWTDDKGIDQSIEYLSQMSDAQTKYIDGLIGRIKDSKFDQTQMSEDEIRDLLSMTNYTEKDGQIRAKHIEYSKNVDLRNKELQKKIQEGRDLLSGKNGMMNLTKYEEFGTKVSEFLRGHEKSGRTIVGQNSDTFDTPILRDAYEYNIKNTFDTLRFAQQYFKIGHKNAQGKMLLAYNLGALADHFGVDMTALEKSGLTQHTGTYDTAMTKAVLEKMIPEAEKEYKAMQGEVVNAGDFGYVKTSLFRRDDDKFSHRRNASGDVIQQDNWGDWLLGKQKAYTFDGVVSEDIDKITRSFAKFTNITNGESTYIHLRQGETVDDILSNTFDRMMKAGTSKNDDSILKVHANKNAILSAFDSRFGWKNLDGLNKDNLTENQRKVLEQIQNGIRSQADGLSDSARSLMMDKIGKAIGVSTGKTFSPGDFYRSLLGAGGKTQGQTKTILKKFVKDHKGEFKKGFVKDFYNTIDNLGFTEDQFNHRDGQSAIYGLTKLMYENLNDSYFADKINSSMIGDFDKVASNSSELDSIIKSTVEDFNSRYGKDALDDMYKNGSQGLKDMLSGEDTLKRLKLAGFNMDKEYSDLYKHLGQKNGKFGKNSIGQILKETIEGKAGTYGQAPIKGLSQQGVGTAILMNPSGTGFRVGFFDNSRVSEFQDADGAPLWHKMAGYIDVGTQDDGSILINGMPTANHLLPMYNKTDGTTIATLREGIFKSMMKGVLSEKNIERIKSGESIMSSLRWYAEEFAERGAGATYKTTEAEGKDFVKAGGTAEQMLTRAYSMDMRKYLIDAAKGAGYTEDDIGHGYDRDNFVSALMDYFTNISLGTESNLENSTQFYLNGVEGLVGGKRKKLSNLKSAISGLAKAKRVDLGSLKEGAYGTERMSYIGSRDFNPFAILQSEQSRATDQFNNYVGRRRSAEDRQKAYDNGITLRNYFSTQKGIDLLGNDYFNQDIYDQFIMGATTDSDIAKFYEDLESGNLDQKLMDFFGGDSKRADAVKQGFLNDPVMSVYEGSLIVSQSVADELEKEAYRQEVKSISERDLQKILPEAVKELKESGKNVYNFKDGELKKNKKLSSSIGLKEGDKIRAIERTAKGYQIVYDRKQHYGLGSKGVSQFGNRSTANRILSDDQFSFYADYSGNKGAGMIQKPEIKSSTLAEIVGGRLSYLVNSHIQEKGDQGVQDVLNALNSKELKNTALSKFLRYDSKSKSFQQNAIYTNDGFKYYDDKGNLQSLFPTDADVEAFFNENYNKDGRLSDLAIFGKKIKGEQAYKETKNLIASSYALSNLYDVKEAVGTDLSSSDLKTLSKFNYGFREKAAVKTSIAAAELSHKNLSFDNLKGYFDTYLDNGDVNALNQELIYNRAFDDNISLIDTHEKNRELDINNRLNSNGESVSSDEILEIVNGEATGKNQVSLSDIFTTDESNYTGIMSKKEFQNTSHGRILQELEKRGMDPNKARVIFRTGHDIEVPNEYGKGGNMISSDFALGITPMLTNERGEVIYGETQRNLNAFLGSVYNYNSARTDSKYRDKNLQRTATDYLTSMFAARNKESQLFEELNRTYVGSSMTGKTVATNLALGEKFDNAMMVGLEDFTKMFTSHADTGTDTFANHINDLLSYYELSFGKSYKKTFDDFNKLTDSKGRKKFEQDIIKDMIKKIDISNKNAQSVFGVGHRYPSTNAQTMMFQRLMVDRSLSANRMRVGLGSGTGMNADFDGDTIGISVPLLQGISKNKDSKDLFKQMEELTKMEDYGKSLLGDWTRANAGLTYKDGKWISEESGDSGAKIEKLAKMRANPQSDAIAGWLSKKNFGSIGQLSIFATKFRNATRDAEMETTPESFLLASAGRALFELTEQGAISSKKVGDRLMKINQGDSEEETMENIIHGVERFRDKIMDYGRRGQYNGLEGSRKKAEDVAKLGREIGLFGDDKEFMSGRQTADFVANMMKIANSDDVDPKVRDLIMNKETGLLARWGVREISTNDKTKGQGGFMSYDGFINMYTDLIEHFGGNAKMLNAINSATFGTQGRTSANIGKTIEKSLVDANKTPTNFDTTDTSGDSTDVQNPDFSIGTLTVGTINAGSIISGSGAGTAIVNSGSGGTSEGIGTISGSGVSNSSIYYPDEPLVLEKGMSVHKHLNFAKGLLAEAQKSLITEKDVENAQVTPLQLNGKKGQHSYSAGGKKIQNAFTFSQLGNLIDATKHGPIDSNQAKLQQQILELFHNGKINFKMTGSEMGKDYTSLQDIINELGNPSDASKLWAMSKVIGTTERGTMVHALMQYGSNRLFKQLKEAKTPEERANILRNGGNKNLREAVAAYENGMRNIGQLGPNSLEDVINKGISFYDMRERLPLPEEGLKEGAREKSYKVAYGTGENAFSVIGTIDEMIRGLGALDWKTEKNIHEKSLNHMLQLMMAQRVFRQVYGDANLGDKALNSIMGSFTGGSFDVAKYDFSQVSNAKEANIINILRGQQLLMDGYAFGDTKVDDFVYKKKMNMFHDSSVKSANDLYSMLYQVTGFKDVDEVMESGEKKGFSISKKNEDNDHTRFYFSKYDADSGQMFDAEAVMDSNGVITEISKISESFKGNNFIKFKTEYDALRAKIEQINKSLESEDLTSAQRRELEEKRLLATKQKYDIYNSQSAAFKKAFETEDRMAPIYDIIGRQTPFVDKNTGDEHSGNEIWGAMQDLISASSALQTAREFWHNANKSGDVARQREAQKELDKAQGRYNEVMESFRGYASFGGFSKEQQEAISQYLNAFDASHMTEMFRIDDTATLRDSKDLMDQYVKIQDENNRLKIQENNYMEAANKSLRKDDKDLNLSKAAQIRSIIDSKNQELSYNASTGTFSYLENGKQKTVQIADPVKKAEFDQRLISQQQTHQMEFQKQQIAHQNTGLFGKIKGGIRNAFDYMVGYSLGYSIIGMVKQAFTMTIQNVMQLNKTMTDLAIVTGKNVSEMKELVGEYNNLAKEIGLTNAEVNASANEWLRMGYKESEINTLIKNTAMLSKLGMIEMGEATQYMTSAIKGYGVAVQDSMQIVDMATSLDMKYAVSAGYILEAMSRTATSAKLAKVEMSDLQAMIAVIGETSQKDASVVGESLKTAFARYGNVKAGAFLGNSDLTSLEDQYEYETFSQENADSLDDAAVNDIEKVLDKMDIDIRNGSEWRSYSDILEEVGKNFKNLSDYEKNAITTAMFGTRQRENGLIVLENYNKVLEAEKIAAEAAGSSIIKYEKYLESVEAAKAKVTTAYEGLILDIKGAEFIKDVLNKIAFALEHIGAILGTIGASTLLLNLPKVLLGFNKLSTLPMFFGNFRDRIANRFSYDGWTNTFNQGYQNLISSGKIGHYERINNEYFRRHGYTDDDIKKDKPWKDMAGKGKINDVANDEKISSIIKDKVDKNPILSKIKNKMEDISESEKIKTKKEDKSYNRQLNRIWRNFKKGEKSNPSGAAQKYSDDLYELNKQMPEAQKRHQEQIKEKEQKLIDKTEQKDHNKIRTEAEKYRNQLLKRVNDKYKSSASNSEMIAKKQSEIDAINNKTDSELMKEKESEKQELLNQKKEAQEKKKSDKQKEQNWKAKEKQRKLEEKERANSSKENKFYNKQLNKLNKRYTNMLDIDPYNADEMYLQGVKELDDKYKSMVEKKQQKEQVKLQKQEDKSYNKQLNKIYNNFKKMSKVDFGGAAQTYIDDINELNKNMSEAHQRYQDKFKETQHKQKISKPDKYKNKQLNKINKKYHERIRKGEGFADLKFQTERNEIETKYQEMQQKEAEKQQRLEEKEAAKQEKLQRKQAKKESEKQQRLEEKEAAKQEKLQKKEQEKQLSKADKYKNKQLNKINKRYHERISKGEGFADLRLMTEKNDLEEKYQNKLQKEAEKQQRLEEKEAAKQEAQEQKKLVSRTTRDNKFFRRIDNRNKNVDRDLEKALKDVDKITNKNIAEGERYRNQLLRGVNKKYKSVPSSPEMLAKKDAEINAINEKTTAELLADKNKAQEDAKKESKKNKERNKKTKEKRAKQSKKEQNDIKQAEKEAATESKTAKTQKNGLLSSIKSGLTPEDRFLNNYRKTMSQADYARAVGIDIKKLAEKRVQTRTGATEVSKTQIDEEMRALNKMNNSQLFNAYNEAGMLNLNKMADVQAKETLLNRYNRTMKTINSMDYVKEAERILGKNEGKFKFKGTEYTNAEDLSKALGENARQNAAKIQSEENLNAESKKILEGYKNKTPQDIEADRLKANYKNKTGQTMTDATAQRLAAKNLTVASGIDAASSMLGLMVGAQAGSAMGQAFAEFIGGDEETWGMVGSAIGMGLLPFLMQNVSSSVTKQFGAVAGSLAGAGIGLAVAGITAAVNKYKKEVEKAEKAQAERVEKSQEKIEKYSSLDTQTKFERYDELAKGVNQYGDNISLTDTEYEEFQTLGDELGEQFDNLVIGADRFGHSLLGTQDGLGGLADASKELLEIEKQKLYKEKLSDPEKGDSLFQKAFEKYTTSRDEIYKTWFRNDNPGEGVAFETGNKGVLRLIADPNGSSSISYRKFVKSSESKDGKTIGEMIEDAVFETNKNKIYGEKLDKNIEVIVARYNKKYWDDNKISDDEKKEQFFKVQHRGDGIEIILPDAVVSESEMGQGFLKEVNNQIDLVNKESIKVFNDEIQKAQQEFTKEFLPAILNTNPIWEQLDDSTQSFVNQVASGIDLAANDIKSADDYKTLIEDKILSPINKLTEEELLKFEQSVAAFADKEHLGIELTLSESSDQYSVNADLMRTAYKNTDYDGYFGTMAKQMGYTYSKKKNEWTDEDGVTYSYKEYETEDGKKIGKWESSDGKVMDDDVYAKIIGTNKAEDILDEITAITSNVKETDRIDRRQNLSKNLTLEEAQWVAKHSDKWIAKKSSNEIIEAAQTEALTSTGTMKSRIQDKVKENSEMTLSDFEDLIESAETVDDVIKGFNSEPLPDGLEKQLNLLKDRADLLGISLAEAYNQAKALSSIDKFGMTTKSVQSIVTESENMMNIAMAVNQGSISGELITYLQDHAPELFAYTGTELSAEIMKSLGTSALIGASLKGTMSNSNAYFDTIYGELKSATGDAKITPSKEFEDFVKNNTDMLKYQDYFKEALTTDGSSYTIEGIALAVSESDEVKEWLENHGVSTSEKGWEEKVSNVGSDILSVGPKVEAEMKKSIADMIVKIDTHNVQQTHRAFKELTKNIRDLNEQLKDLEKQNAINKLNNELERLTINIDGLDKKISLFDWASGFLAEGDFEGKSKALEDNLSALADKNKDLSAAMAEVESKTPKSAEEAEALKQKYDELSSSYIENQKAILEVQKQMESLGVTMLSSAVTESFEALNKQMQTTSDYAKVSNLRTYTGGATGLLNYNLSGTLESKSEIDKKRSQYDTLLKMREDFNNQLLKYDKQYLDMKEKQDSEDYNKQKSDTAESIRDARVEFFQEHGHILQEKLGKDGAMAAVGITQQDINDYYSSKLNLDPVSIEETMKKVNDDFTKKAPEEEPYDKTSKGDKEPKAKIPTIEGTDAKVDTPESVSNHITETMKAGVDKANAEMAENSEDYGIKAPPLNDSSWGVTVTDGLGLKFRNAYIEVIKALNKYIENPDTQDAKLTSPPLKWSGKRGWENDLVNRMKTKTNEAIEKVNEYLTNGESTKLKAPTLDATTWETFGITIGKYIYTGIEFALQEGIEKDLDVLFDEYKESRKNNTGNDRGSGHLTSKAVNSSPLGLGMSRLGGSPTASNGIPVGATVYMESPTSPQYGHVGIMGSDGKVWHWSGSKVLNQSLDHLSSRGFIPYSWGWHGGTPLSYNEAMALDALLQQRKGQNCGKSQCQKWVGLTYSDALNTSYISSGGSAKIAGSKWGVNSLNGDLSVLKDYSSNPFFAFSHASGTDSHKGGLALIGDEGLVNNKSGLFPELVILPNGEIALMGTQGPVLTNLPKGTEVLNNTDTNEFIGVNSYADGTGVDNLEIKDLTVTGDLTVKGNNNVSGDLNTGDNKYGSVIDEIKVSQFEEQFENYLDQITGERENTQRILEETYKRNNYKIPVLSEYEKLANQELDTTTRYSYKLIRDLYSRDDEISNYKMLANDAAKKHNEALYNMGLAKEQGADVEVVKAWSEIVNKYKDQMIEAEQAIENSLDATMQAFQTFADEVNGIYNNIKENLDADYGNGWLGEKTSSNYYNPLKEAADERIKNISDAYNGALQEAINKYLKLGFNIDVATSKAMEEDVVKELQKSSKNAIRERTQIELDENNDRIANYERANQKIEEQLGYNSNLSNSQFKDVYTDTLVNTQDMIAADIRALKDIENLSPEDQKALIDRLNKNTKAQIDIQSAYIDNILNNAKRLTDASVNERDKQLSVGGITTYDTNGKSIFEKNIEDFKEEGEAIAQAIVDTRVNLTAEAKRMGITDEDKIEEYINNNEKMISLNEQHLDNLKKQSEEHRKIRDYTLEQLNNEKKLLDLSKENEWASKANIQNYYDAVDESLDAQIAAQKKYLESKNLSEEEYQKTKMSIAELEREKHNNALQRMQDTQAYYEKEYSAMTYMVNEYITALSDEKETISDTYDEEIDKLQQVNNAKERSIKLTELQNNLENAQNEKKRVYRAGVGFVYEQDRAAVKKAKDELDAFYRQDQIDNLTKAKEMETKILDERIEKWNKYLDAMEKVYKTAERNHNIGILENLLGTEGWQGVFDELNADMSNFIKEYDAGMKIYHGEWTGFLEEYEKLSTKIYDKLESSVELLKNIKEYEISDTSIDYKKASVEELDETYKDDNIKKYENKNDSKHWKDERWRNKIRDFSALYSTEEGRAFAQLHDISVDEANFMHNEKGTELLSFARQYGYEELFKILTNPEINDTNYSITEIKDAIDIATKNKLDLGELTHKEASIRLDYINNLEMAKKTNVINNLLNDTVDIASKIKDIEDGSVIRLDGVDFTKEELEEIRAEKIWMNYRTGKYNQMDVNGNVDHYKTLEYLVELVDDIDGNEDKNDIGDFGTGIIGKFWDSLLNHKFNGTKVEELSKSIHALIEGQSKALDEENTTIFDIYRRIDGQQEYESTNIKGSQISPNFNLYNYYITKENNKIEQILQAAEANQSITNNS